MRNRHKSDPPKPSPLPSIIRMTIKTILSSAIFLVLGFGAGILFWETCFSKAPIIIAPPVIAAPIPTQTEKPTITVQPDATPAPKPAILYAKTTSGAGILLIARFEGFYQTPYNDVAGHCTIGYGHLIHQGECKGQEFPDYLSQGQAWNLLKDDLKASEFAIWQNIDVPLLQNQYDAIVSIVFNMGWDMFDRTGIPAMINASQFSKVPAEIRKNACCWTGIQNRRED